MGPEKILQGPPQEQHQTEKSLQRFHFTSPEVHARGYIAITSSLIEYLLAKLLSFQGFIVLFGMGSLSNGSNKFQVLSS